MADTFGERIRKAWNVFTSKEQTTYRDYGPTYYSMPGARPKSYIADKTIINSIYNRISLDVSSVDINHVALDEFGRYSEILKTDLNRCLNISANTDQTGRALIQDAVLTMLEEGAAAIVPIYKEYTNGEGNGMDIQGLRVGSIKEWHPGHVKVEVFNANLGRKVEVFIAKEDVAIIQNPFYSVMNSPNGTMHRLLRKLALLDAIDEANSSGRMDMIIQLPYTVRSELRKTQAEDRRKEIETQLRDSKYGIAYIDGTEKITQLNRPVENNLLTQIEKLTAMMYTQLGLTEEIMNGSANDSAMLNYFNRTVDVILTAIVEELRRKFLSIESIDEGQSIIYLRNQLKFVPFMQLAQLADSLTRNEILTSNEIRQAMGFAPSTDPNADTLRNKNLNPTGGFEDEYGQEPYVEPQQDFNNEPYMEEQNGEQ